MARLLFVLMLSGLIAASSPLAAQSSMSTADLTYFPEPKLRDIIGGGYTVDRAATEAHYDRLFRDKTAAEVVMFLEGSGVHVFYPSDTEISVDIVMRVVLFEYTVGLAFFFQDGLFQRSKVHGPGWK